MALEFAEDFYSATPDSGAVWFGAKDGDLLVTCFAERAALEKLAGGRLDDAGLRHTFERHRAQLEDIALAKYEAGKSEPDGAKSRVTVTKDDLWVVTK